MANILIINSSARNKNNTRILAAAAAEAAEKNGHAVTTIDVGRADIKPCVGCEGCHQGSGGPCVIDDAMTAFYPEVTRAEVIVFSAPIYYFSINAQAKAFLDRCYSLGVEAFRGKRVGAIFAYGDEDPVKSGCINAIRMFQDICAYASAQWLGAVYGTAWEEGEAGDNAELLEKARAFGAAL